MMEESEMRAVQRLSALIEDLIIEAGQKQVAKVETILRQLVAGGHSLADVVYQHRPDENLEVVVCQGVRVLTVVRTHSIYEIKTVFTIYPDGRPGGWPKLSFDSD
jgi:hypothetical protein